jgi:hypothetical protein
MSANQKAIAFGRAKVAIASPMLIKNNICQTKRDRLRNQKRFHRSSKSDFIGIQKAIV